MGGAEERRAAKGVGVSSREKGARADAERIEVPLRRPVPPGSWQQPTERLEELYQWVEDGALTAADWYWRRRRAKRRAALLLRWGTAVSASLVALLPALALAGAAPADALLWGYGALLVAAGCPAADRYFALTAGWMRYVSAAQAIGRALEELQYDWAHADVRASLGPAGPSLDETTEYALDLLHRCSAEIDGIVRSETADWTARFCSLPAPPYRHSAERNAYPGGAARTRPPPGCGGRSARPQGAVGAADPRAERGRTDTQGGGVRIQMPRQRPPEGPVP